MTAPRPKIPPADFAHNAPATLVRTLDTPAPPNRAAMRCNAREAAGPRLVTCPRIAPGSHFSFLTGSQAPGPVLKLEVAHG